MGRNKYTSSRQRYLNSGYALGPVSRLRDLFRRAWEQARATKDLDDWDNGSHGSDFMYHGSDQSIFNIILGEQEYQREVLRRRYLSDDARASGLDESSATAIEGTWIHDILNPSFTHEGISYPDGMETSELQFEYGIGLDYWSQLGQQTVNAEEDSRFLQYDEEIARQTMRKHLFDCPSRVTGEIALDILNSTKPMVTSQSPEPKLVPAEWRQVPLYTNLCLNSIPVMIHHNGDKAARERQWPDIWLQPHAQQLLEAATDTRNVYGRDRAERSVIATVYQSDDRTREIRGLSWDDLCSDDDIQNEIFR